MTIAKTFWNLSHKENKMGLDFVRRYKKDGASELFAKLPNGRWHGPYAEDNCEVIAANKITEELYVEPPIPSEPTNEEKLSGGDLGVIQRLPEDLVDILIAKGVIIASDLALESEYNARKILRST